MLKPDCLDGRHTGEVISQFEKAGFEIRATKLITLTDELLQEHYAHIADRPFSGDRRVHELAPRVDTRARRRKCRGGHSRIAGADRFLQAAGTIRGDMGTTSMKNICHASDSVENAAIEVDRFFEPSEVH